MPGSSWRRSRSSPFRRACRACESCAQSGLQFCRKGRRPHGGMVQHVQVHQPHGSEVLRQCLALRVDTRKSAGSVEHAVRREPHADPVRADGSHLPVQNGAGHGGHGDAVGEGKTANGVAIKKHGVSRQAVKKNSFYLAYFGPFALNGRRRIATCGMGPHTLCVGSVLLSQAEIKTDFAKRLVQAEALRHGSVQAGLKGHDQTGAHTKDGVIVEVL